MKEGIPSAPVPQKSNEPKDPGRRSFFKRAGALSVAAIAGSFLPEDAEARNLKSKKETAYEKMVGNIPVTLVGYNIERHELVSLEIFIKNYLPNAASIKFSFGEATFDEGMDDYKMQLHMHAILNDGSIVICKGNLQSLGDPLMNFDELFKNLKNGQAIHKKDGTELPYKVK